jgi:hypothetical protein
MSGSNIPRSRPIATASMVGYSGKPLCEKLGLKPALRVRLVGGPAEYWAWCGFDSERITLVEGARSPFDFGHLFASARRDLENELVKFAAALDRNGMLWISWPKKSSGIVTDVSEDTLRAIALPRGLVDVKVCAVSAVWSGLKFVWRREHRH